MTVPCETCSAGECFGPQLPHHEELHQLNSSLHQSPPWLSCCVVFSEPRHVCPARSMCHAGERDCLRCDVPLCGCGTSRPLTGICGAVSGATDCCAGCWGVARVWVSWCGVACRLCRAGRRPRCHHEHCLAPEPHEGVWHARLCECMLKAAQCFARMAMHPMQRGAL